MSALTIRPEIRVEVNVSALISATLLALPTPELHATLLAEAHDNPLLVVRQFPVCRRCARRLVGNSCPRCGSAVERGPVEPAAGVSAWEQLRLDARAAAPKHLVDAVLAVLCTLDERGLLTTEARETLLRHAIPVDPAIAILREVGPPGIAAATPAESLLVQLDDCPLPGPERDLARRLLTVHAEALANGDLTTIATTENCPPATIQALLARLRRLLRPYPGLGATTEPVTAPPDLRFEADGDRITAMVTEREALDVRIDPGPARQIRDAKTVLARVELRWSLLQRLGDLLADRHADQLRAGSLAFRPLTQSRAARELGVHESTISRAVAHRHARLVNGELITLGRMFGTNHDVRALIGRLCRQAPRPSDQRVVLLLAEHGITLSRRAVTKHRHALGIR